MAHRSAVAPMHPAEGPVIETGQGLASEWLAGIAPEGEVDELLEMKRGW
jgi:hypothetical protein